MRTLRGAILLLSVSVVVVGSAVYIANAPEVLAQTSGAQPSSVSLSSAVAAYMNSQCIGGYTGSTIEYNPKLATGATEEVCTGGEETCKIMTNYYNHECSGSGQGGTFLGQCKAANDCKAYQYKDPEGQTYNVTGITAAQSSDYSFITIPAEAKTNASTLSLAPSAAASEPPQAGAAPTVGPAAGTGATYSGPQAGAAPTVGQQSPAPAATAAPTAAAPAASAAPTATAPSQPTFTGTPGLNNSIVQSGVQPTGVAQTTGGLTYSPTTGFSYSPTSATFGSTLSQSGYTTTYSNSGSVASKSSTSNSTVSAIVNFFSSLLSVPSYASAVVGQVSPSVETSLTSFLSSTNSTATQQSQPAAQTQSSQSTQSGSSILSVLNNLLSPSTLFPTLAQTSSQENSQQTTSSSTEASSASQLGENTFTSSSVLQTNVASLALENITDLNGEWTYSPQHLQDEQSLAQAQSDLQWLQAQEQALQASQSAGVCDSDCESDLASIETQIPQAEQVVAQDTATVNEPIPASFAAQEAQQTQAQTEENSTGEIVSQQPGFSQTTPSGTPSSSVAPSLQELASESVTPAAPAAVPQASSQSQNISAEQEYAAQEAELSSTSQPPTPAPASSPVDQFISNVVQTVENWFSPASTSTTQSSQSCSLLSSLFGGCSGL